MINIYNIFVFLLLLLFAFICKKSLQLGIYSVVFLVPCYLLKIKLGGIPFSILELCVYILCLYNLKNFKYNYQEWLKIIKNNLELFVGGGLLFVGLFLSLSVSQDQIVSLGIIKGFFINPWLFLWVLISNLKRQSQVWLMIVSNILSGLVVALIAVFYAMNGVYTFDGRLRAFYESPNYLAMYIAPSLLFFLGYLWVHKKQLVNKWWRFVAWIVGSLFVGVLFLTKSVGAILAVSGAILLWLWQQYKVRNQYAKPFRWWLLGVMAAIGVVCVIIGWSKFHYIMNSADRSSFHSRLTIWQVSWFIWKDSPIVGIGPGCFQQHYLAWQSSFEPYLEWAVTQPHNTFLAFLLQTGLLGCVGFLLICRWMYLRRQCNPEILTIFIYYFSIHSLVDTLYWKNDLAFIFVMILGVTYASYNINYPRSVQ